MSNILHLTVIEKNEVIASDYAFCGSVKILGEFLTKNIDDVTCPYCKFKWFKQNKHRIRNVPKTGSVIVHWTTTVINNEWVACCGPVDVNKFHICASNDFSEVNCTGCLEKRQQFVATALHAGEVQEDGEQELPYELSP